MVVMYEMPEQQASQLYSQESAHISVHASRQASQVAVPAPEPTSTYYAPIAEIGARALLNHSQVHNLPRLYIHPIAADSLGPWMVLKEAGIPAELIIVDPIHGETNTSDFLAMNPTGKLPVFVGTDGAVIWGTNSVLRYLAERYPQAEHFYPRDANLRGRVEMALDWRFTSLLPPLQKVTYPALGWSGDHERSADAKIVLDGVLRVLTDFYLRETPFIGGLTPCIADYSVALPLLYLYATDYRTPAKVREYLEAIAAKTPCWNEVTEELKNFMTTPNAAPSDFS